MKLILLAFLGLIVAATAQEDQPLSSNPGEWHTVPNQKAGFCPQEMGWGHGPHLLTEQRDDEKEQRDDEKETEAPNSLLNFGSYPYFRSYPHWLWPTCFSQCHSDADCNGTLKCCGSQCNRHCTIPRKYDEQCGLIPTDEYCKELCDRKNTCLTTTAPNCRDYHGYCVSYCRSNDSCFGRKCCRDLSCSFTCRYY